MSNLFKTKCPYCGKDVFTYAVSKSGELANQYCSKACENNAKHDQRFIKIK
jgi:endogenous inhibitor of DNA gyrase (YacG/DUF329 family)